MLTNDNGRLKDLSSSVWMHCAYSYLLLETIHPIAAVTVLICGLPYFL